MAPWQPVSRSLLLAAAVLLWPMISAHAEKRLAYDVLVEQADLAEKQERFAECASLYGRAEAAVPADRSPAELQILRENRRSCQRHQVAPPPPARVLLGRLTTGVSRLIGRQEELTQLDQSWDGRTRRHVVAVVAMGGQGKTTLVVHWLLRMAGENYRGARRVFGWSFYSQGTSDERAASADEFFAAALKFFGDPTPIHGTSFQKADRLVELIRQERSLLVLDGLEPLQYGPGASQGEGRLKDRALASLLRDLAVDNPGLVVVTSRAKVTNLEAFEGNFLLTIALRPFSVPDGVELLRLLKVKGNEEELRAAVRDFKGHPLALTLLGNLLVEAWGGDVRRRSEVGPLEYDDAKGGQAGRAMAAYDRWFGVGPERQLLRLLGLFDRPAPGAALKALRTESGVPGLNNALRTLKDATWNQVISRLRKAGLVEVASETDPGGVDAHPLVREHFGEALRKESEAAWRAGHGRLYQWYSASTKEQPDTLAEMVPLYDAVLHGCRAGRYQEALDRVLWPRILRFNDHYSITKLGAFGAELSAMSGFFEEPWTRPVSALRQADRGFVLNEVGFALRALGRLEEAVGPLQAAVETYRVQKDWKRAAIATGNLSELQLALGQLDESVASARRAVALADWAGDPFERLSKRSTLANALYQKGKMGEARDLWIESESMQRQWQPDFPILYSQRGYQYCDLLVAQNETDEVLRRADLLLLSRQQKDSLLDIGLYHLALGEAHLARFPLGPAEVAPARHHLDEAVTRLRGAGHQEHLALGLIHRAGFFRLTRDFDPANRDLNEALRLASRGHMRLQEADAHLERARLISAQKRPKSAARTELDLAQTLINQTGYARRRPEVAALTKTLNVK